MKTLFDSLAPLLSDIILPNLKAVQRSQAVQIAANKRLEESIDELRLHLNSQFALLTIQLAACRVELAATQKALRSAGVENPWGKPDGATLIH